MKTITLALPFEETAAAIADRLARQDAPLVPMQLDMIAIGLVRWVELELVDLLAEAPRTLDARTLSGKRLLAALAAAARLEQDYPPLRTLRERRKAARQLANRFGRRVEDWMLWELWHGQIGCNVCQVQGPKASCWGAYGCHGYLSGCGCADCTAHARIVAYKRETAQQEPIITGGKVQ